MPGSVVVGVCTVGPQLVGMARGVCAASGLPSSTMSSANEIFAMHLEQSYPKNWESFCLLAPSPSGDASARPTLYAVEFAAAEMGRLAKRLYMADVVVVAFGSAAALGNAARSDVAAFRQVLEVWLPGRIVILAAPAASGADAIDSAAAVREWEARWSAGTSTSPRARCLDQAKGIWELDAGLFMHLSVDGNAPFVDAVAAHAAHLAHNLFNSYAAQGQVASAPAGMRAQIVSKTANKTLICRLICGFPVKHVWTATSLYRTQCSREPMKLACVADVATRFPKSPTGKERKKMEAQRKQNTAATQQETSEEPFAAPPLATGDFFVAKVSTSEYGCQTGIVFGSGDAGTLDSTYPKTIFAVELVTFSPQLDQLTPGSTSVELTLDGWSRATFALAACASEGPTAKRLLLINTGWSIPVPICAKLPCRAAVYVRPEITCPILCEVRALLPYGALHEAVETSDFAMMGRLLAGRPPGFTLYNDAVAAAGINLNGATFATLELHTRVRRGPGAGSPSLAVHIFTARVDDPAWASTVRSVFGSIYPGPAMPMPPSASFHPLSADLAPSMNWQVLVDRLVDARELAGMLQRPLFAQIAVPLVKACVAKRRRATLLTLVRQGWDEIASDDVIRALLSAPGGFCPLWLPLRIWSIPTDPGFTAKARLGPLSALLKTATVQPLRGILENYVTKYTKFVLFPMDVLSAVDFVRACSFLAYTEPVLPPRVTTHIFSFLHPISSLVVDRVAAAVK